MGDDQLLSKGLLGLQERVAGGEVALVLSTQWAGRGHAGCQGGSDSSPFSGQNPQLNLRSQPAAWLLGHFLHFKAKQQQMEMLRGSGAASGSKTL